MTWAHLIHKIGFGSPLPLGLRHSLSYLRQILTVLLKDKTHIQIIILWVAEKRGSLTNVSTLALFCTPQYIIP